MKLFTSELVLFLQTFTVSPLLCNTLLLALIPLFLLVWYLWQPKQYYFIRHGETLLNKSHTKQGAEGGLSPKGIEQAKELGEVFSSESIQLVFTSPYERAIQTATLILKRNTRRMRITNLLAERKNASEVVGKSTSDPEVIRITALTAQSFHDDSYRFSDEENFLDLKKRAKKCLSFLKNTNAHRIVVVTHHAFLHMLLSYMLYREDLDEPAYTKLGFFNPAENGGVTVCTYHPWHSPFSKTKGWEVISYNQVV